MDNVVSQQLDFIPINIPTLDTILTNLVTTGIVKIAENGFVYLDIDDGYINEIYPLIANANILKPDYFSAETNFVGAHISIAYPDGHIKLDKLTINTQHDFKVLGLATTTLLNNCYYALQVQASTAASSGTRQARGSKRPAGVGRYSTFAKVT